MGIVGMPCDEAILNPPDESAFADSETRSCLSPRQQSPIPEPVVAGAEAVLIGEIGDPEGGELRVRLTLPRRTAGADSAAVQNVGDFGIDVAVEEHVDEFDDLGIGLDLLSSSHKS
jgi:hypothetical protein